MSEAATMDTYRNCVTAAGSFLFGIHKPSYPVANLRPGEAIEPLGLLEDETVFDNQQNFPAGDVNVEHASWIYEITNPLPFRGTTFIDKRWADLFAEDPSPISLPRPRPLSFASFLNEHDVGPELIGSLPRPLLLTLATCSTDPADLVKVAERCCTFIRDAEGSIAGLLYRRDDAGRIRPEVHDHDLFEAVANNPALPRDYQKAMVLRPGAQGGSEIVGEWRDESGSHVYEYLRRNSYIAGGHFAANMADDAVRYSIAELSQADMHGLRHLYYQRMYIRLAELAGLAADSRGPYTEESLEKLRLALLAHIDTGGGDSMATLWGWNFGFDYTPTDYRLHASHQQIHQQYAVVPATVEAYAGSPGKSAGRVPSFACGDMVAEAMAEYRRARKSELFADYCRAIAANTRMDGREDRPSSLVVWQDERVMVFVPKAQTSQWELQVMVKADKNGVFAGNIIEADRDCRASLDTALLKAQQVLAGLGARMVTSIEYAKRIDARGRTDQPLLYALLPKLPFAPGAFSEAQLRFINRHYPEDFAAVCRQQLH